MSKLQRLNYHRLAFTIVLGLIGLGSAWFAITPSHAEPGTTTPVSTTALPANVTFNRYIRPIFSDKCFACHGPDINKRISGMRLDKKDEAFGPMPKHPDQHAFVPGHPEHRWAYLRMTSKDPNERMSQSAIIAPLMIMKERWSKNGSNKVPSGKNTGPSLNQFVSNLLRSRTQLGRTTISTTLFSPSWKKMACNLPNQPTSTA